MSKKIRINSIALDAASYRSKFKNDKNGHASLAAFTLDKSYRVLFERTKLL